MSDYLEVNRANWNDRVPIHAASKFYDLDGWAANPLPLQPWESEYTGDVTGLDVVHLQCHIGTDTLALLVSGAKSVTGIDFSGEALEVARDLAERSGLADRATFVESDVYRASEVLDGKQFDLVFVSLGALCWLPSVARWAEQVSLCLKPGGRLYIHDVHPVAWARDENDPTRWAYTYFEEAKPFEDTIDVTYTDGDGRLEHSKAYEWNHSMGELINALIAQGMRIDSLTEHDWTVFEMFAGMTDNGQSQFHLPTDMPRLPLTFSLTATKA